MRYCQDHTSRALLPCALVAIGFVLTLAAVPTPLWAQGAGCGGTAIQFTSLDNLLRTAWEYLTSGAVIRIMAAAFIIAGVLMAYGESGSGASRKIFSRVLDAERGPRFAALATATIRAVAQGVIGIAFIQAMLVGLCLLLAGIPWAGVLAAITLVLSIAQIPALIVILPVIGYIWSSGDYGTGAAIGYSVLLLLALGMLWYRLKELL